MAGIQRLGQQVGDALRSSFILPSMCQAIEEVILNSIDAGATSLQIDFSLEEWSFSVVDDGRGMTSDDVDKVGERYGES